MEHTCSLSLSEKVQKFFVNYVIFVIGRLLCCFWREFYNYIVFMILATKKFVIYLVHFLFIIIFKPSQKIYAVKYFVIRTLQYWVQINCLFSTKISVHMFVIFKTINLYCLLTSYYFINIILFMLFCVQYFIKSLIFIKYFFCERKKLFRHMLQKLPAGEKFAMLVFNKYVNSGKNHYAKTLIVQNYCEI